MNIVSDLIRFLEGSPTCFHAIKNTETELERHGFTRLSENEAWNLTPGGSYYVTRNGSSLIAFSIPAGSWNSMHILASHSDSPCFKIKEHPELETEGHYIRLNVERYGGMILAPWLDRPLSVAGRVIVKDADTGTYTMKLGQHRPGPGSDPESGHPHEPGRQQGLYLQSTERHASPVWDPFCKDTFMKTIARAAGVEESDILGHDLFLYNREKASIWGADQEFLSCGRLDDLQCAFASLAGFLAGKKERYLNLHCVFDNEEVGSGTRQGAASTFLYDTLTRIFLGLGRSTEDYLISLADSMMISADNAHAVHPNHPDKADPSNRPYLGEGIVIKYNASQKYCTDGISTAMFRDLCREAGVPVQTFANRSDMAGGSTLGNISNTQVPLNTIDIGLPQLAMHSPYETASVKDTEYLVRAAKEFFA